MCTLLCRWQPDDQFTVQLLALRDEYASRDFDRPDTWWSQQPNVVGGKDRSKGGSWCVSDIVSGASAVVLNNPRKRTASPDAPSRGVLPLLAIQYGDRWPEHLDTQAMAGFHLVLASPKALRWWTFDGENLIHQELPTGTYMFTPLELRTSDFGDDRLLQGRFHAEAGLDAPAHEAWAEWLDAIALTVPSTNPEDLLVRLPHNGESYETVFAQCIASHPGVLRVDYLDRPVRNPHGTWTNAMWRLPA